MTTPESIIGAFDEILDYVFGRSRGRDYPYKTDSEIAQEWIDQGLTLPIACAVFYHQISRLHENWSKQHNHNDRKNIPSTLKFFNDYMLAAIQRVRAGGEPIAVWEQSESQWRARIKSWYAGNGRWLKEMWGPEPGTDGCRAPPRLLLELKPKVKKKNA